MKDTQTSQSGTNKHTEMNFEEQHRDDLRAGELSFQSVTLKAILFLNQIGTFSPARFQCEPQNFMLQLQM